MDKSTGEYKDLQDKADTLAKTTVSHTSRWRASPEAEQGILDVQTAMDNLKDKTVTIFVKPNIDSRLIGPARYRDRRHVHQPPDADDRRGRGRGVVPLQRPLNLVDPSVRWLSALAQGKATQGMAAGGIKPGIDVGGITIITPTEDPGAVAPGDHQPTRWRDLLLERVDHGVARFTSSSTGWRSSTPPAPRRTPATPAPAG